MPPKFKFTREEIISSALDVTRKNGIQGLTARALANELGCSVKPIFGLFKNMEEVQTEVILSAANLYYKYLQEEMTSGKYPPYKASGMGYIRFAKEEKELFLSDMGLEQSGLDRLISECYSLLGLISYLTAGKQEVRAWTIKKGTKAPQAAGKIHTDFERGFIRAEIIKYEDYIAYGSEAAVKEAGKMHIEGKDYVFQDGDIVVFRFNV